jgi:hypothetical protein
MCIERNVCRCTFNRYSVITLFTKLAAGEQLCRLCTYRKLAYSTSKPLKVSPEKSQILSCDTVVVVTLLSQMSDLCIYFRVEWQTISFIHEVLVSKILSKHKVQPHSLLQLNKLSFRMSTCTRGTGYKVFRKSTALHSGNINRVRTSPRVRIHRPCYAFSRDVTRVKGKAIPLQA